MPQSPNDWPHSTSPSKDNPPANSVGIIIPVRDGLKFFKLCFHSVLSFTDHPYSLTIIDNKSSLQSKKYFGSIAKNHDINVLRFNEEFNFAAQANLGCKYAFSFPGIKYALLLNADAVVTPGYLSSMVRAMNGNPRIAVVGPMSNKANPEQSDPEKLNRYSLAQRASGFCMLIRREAWEEMGGFDEGFKGGGFEDWDFCERARRKDWHVVLDGFTYIFHFYKSFRRENEDAHDDMMRANEKRFFEKHPLVRSLVEAPS